MSDSAKYAIVFVAGIILGALVLYLILGTFTITTVDESSPAGSATTTIYTDVLDNRSGFIVEKAVLAGEGTMDAQKLFGVAPVVEGQGSLMVIKGVGKEETVKTLLVLQIPAFAEGTTIEFTGEPREGRFYVVNMAGSAPEVLEGGLLSGSVRCIRTVPSTTSIPGFMGELREGTGDIEVLVSNINAGTVPMDPTKKYAARYNLPIVPLERWGGLGVAL